MQALVLAGGEGTRLRPLTTTVPKPVLPLANRPFISYMLDWLAGHGFDDIVMSCGFLADGVRNVLGEGDRNGLRIRYVEEPEPLGTAGAVKFAEDLLDERFAVLNGDVLTDFDLSAVRESHEERGARATLTLIEVQDPSAYGLVLTEPDGRVTDFLEKPEAPIPGRRSLINAGAYVLERDVLDLVPAGRAVSFEHEVFPALVGKGLYGCAVEGYWLDIGTPDRFLEATRDILDGTVETGVTVGRDSPCVGAGSTVADGAELRPPVLVGDSCAIAASGEIGPVAVLGDGCAVGERARIENAVIHARAQVAEGAIVRDSIIGAGALIGAGSRIEQGTVVGEDAEVSAGATLANERVEPPGGPGGL